MGNASVRSIVSSFAFFMFGGISSLSSANVINIDFNGSRVNNGGVPGVTYTGQGALATSDTHLWNGLNLPDPGNNNTGTGGGTFNNLIDSSGAPTTVGINVPDTFSQNLGPTGNQLLNEYIFTTNYFGSLPPTATVTLTGLTPGGAYNLYLYGTNGRGGNGATFTVGGVSQQTDGAATPAATPDGVTNPFGLGHDYVVYNNQKADGSGDLTIQLGLDAGGHIDAFNGLQLQSVPEPASIAILGVGGLLLARRRR